LFANQTTRPRPPTAPRDGKQAARLLFRRRSALQCQHAATLPYHHTDAIPLDTCMFCGLPGPHRRPDDCIDTLRDRIATLELGPRREPRKREPHVEQRPAITRLKRRRASYGWDWQQGR
jgi:hypothetical protein